MSPGTCHISRWHLLLRYMDSTEGELPYPDGHPHQRSALLAGAALVPDLSRSSKPRVMGVLAVRKRGHSGLEQTNSGKKAPETLVWNKIHAKIPTYIQMRSSRHQPWSHGSRSK